MINLLLVEDELETRDGLFNFISSNILGIDSLQTAEDGLAAINLCESIHPDILVTDVRMPKMDGIQLASYIHQRFPKCKIIFLSGYSDKEYLKAAIHLGALSYIEKPVDLDELTSVISEAVIKVENDIALQEEELQRQTLIQENKIHIYSKLAVSATYNSLSFDSIKTLLTLNEDINNTIFSTSIIKLHQKTPLSKEECQVTQFDLLEFIGDASFCKNDLLYALPGFIDELTLVIHYFIKSTAKQDVYLTQIINSIDIISHNFTAFSFSSIIGKTVNSFSECYISAKSAISQLHRLFYMDKDVQIIADDTKVSSYVFVETDYKLISQMLMNVSYKEFIDYLDNLEENICKYPDSNTGYIKNIYFRILLMIYQCAEEKNINNSMFHAEDTYIWQQISEMENMTDITQYIKTIIREYNEIIKNRKQSGRQINDILKYIDNNFNNPNISIKNIADYSHYDHYYLCTLFKKNTGKTLNDYITNLRIEKAKELLKDKTIKLYDITGMVGYADPSYFCKIFKKFYGTTPSEFRENFL